jgi:hypothetical protein
VIKNDKLNCIIRRMVLGAMAAVIATASQIGYGQIYDYFDPDVDYDRGYCLLIEQSPVDAGKITPQSGIYNAELDEVVVLRAIARPGYQFAYWLGDVTDPTTNETTIIMDSPKIVMAVFERSKFDLPIEGGIISGIGSGGLRGVPDFRPRRGGGASAGGSNVPPRIEPPEPPEPLGNEFPVPAEPFPVPENDNEEIPEPATVILLGLGVVPLVVRRRGRKPTT